MWQVETSNSFKAVVKNILKKFIHYINMVVKVSGARQVGEI